MKEMTMKDKARETWYNAEHSVGMQKCKISELRRKLAIAEANLQRLEKRAAQLERMYKELED